MPRFSIEDSSSSGEEAEPTPKRRRARFPTRFLYRFNHRNNTNTNTKQQIDDDEIGSTSVQILGNDGGDNIVANEDEEDRESVSDEEIEEDEIEVEMRRDGNGNLCTRYCAKELGAPTQAGTSGNSGPISVTLSDPDVLDCAICFEPLTLPVYQCENGHIACSSCCSKLRNKCPSCCSPIGYNRCRALEKVLESINISCVNSEYGCQEKVPYSKKHVHEQTCAYEPCSCPHRGCCFIGCYKDLYMHFSRDHPSSAAQFKWGSFFSIPISTNMRYMILQEYDRTLFILNYGVQSIGNVANITYIGPSSLQKEFSYQLVARKDDSCVKLTSFTRSMPKWSVHLPQTSVLLVPKDFIGSSRVHTVEVCICKNVDNRLSN